MPDQDPDDHASYSERLWPGIWAWAVAGGTLAMVAIAYGAALGAGVGWLIAAIGAGALALLVWRGTPRISLGDTGLTAGRATLPWQFVGRVVELDAAGVAGARGPHGDPSAFQLSRPGVGPGAVVVEVTDPEDPHRTWLLASRKPQALACAIDRSRGRVQP